MNAKPSATALKLLNLYRQEHVIIGGWTSVNPIFVQEATDDVLNELKDMPTGKLLIQHIQNLRSGKTPMNSIERDLLPYGGMMAEAEAVSVNLSQDQWHELENAIDNFTPNQTGLDSFLSTAVVQKFGAEWPNTIRAILNTQPRMLEKWNVVVQTYNAYRLWNTANEIIENPVSERVRAQVQADLPEYETYLPMFGDAGNELLTKLRAFVSSKN